MWKSCPNLRNTASKVPVGPDGYLYLSLEDSGKRSFAQDKNDLRGKLLRCDLSAQQVVPEIYAIGFRNPWRFLFDKATGDLWLGDVGDNAWEEINIIEDEKNYGWPAYEVGYIVNAELVNELGDQVTFPVAAYDHKAGISVIGGYVYNGNFSSFKGHYLFADWVGQLFYLNKNRQVRKARVEGYPEGKLPFYINSMGEDHSGAIYLLTQNKIGAKDTTGAVYRLKISRTQLSENPPAEQFMDKGEGVQVSAAQGQFLIDANDCSGCHRLDEKLVGPSYRQITDRYEPTIQNKEYLADKIINGGEGVWGDARMFAHKHLSEKDAQSIVAYIYEATKQDR